MQTRYGRTFLVLMLLILSIPAAVLASPGGTDANGGHYNHETGLYHYHHGYPEHQHENGICPYTGEKWELKIPEKPATLEEWEAAKHSADEKPAIDNETPENDDWKVETTSVQPSAADEAERQGTNPLPIAAAGGAALLGGAYAVMHGRKKKKAEPETGAIPPEVPVSDGDEIKPDAAAADESRVQTDDGTPEAVIPDGTVIGDDGLPWEAEAYAKAKAKAVQPGMDRPVATNFSEPKWGRIYSFCVDADGEEIHTLTCEQAFIQITAADRNCPKIDCPICHPVRPDLGWYQEYLRRRAAQSVQSPAADDPGKPSARN
ncbi:MAG: YHYH domain-containing protein [Clostridia bacterium]|nr:YHYH domain-containing protein [Clostridia bacterium]